MDVKDLTRDQMDELKIRYAIEMAGGRDLSYAELLDSSKIPDETIFKHYEGIRFVKDDFFSSYA